MAKTKKVNIYDMEFVLTPEISFKTAISFRIVSSKPGVSIRCTLYRALYTKVYSSTSAEPRIRSSKSSLHSIKLTRSTYKGVDHR